MCTALYGLYINADRRDVIDRVDQLIGQFDLEEYPGLYLEHAYCHLAQSLDDGDLEQARHWIAKKRAYAPYAKEGSQQLMVVVTDANEAIVELRDGDPDRALELLDGLERKGVARPYHAPELTVLRVRTQVARGAIEDARGDAEVAKEALQQAGPFSLSDCVLFGTQLARIYEEDLKDPATALEVYDLAATAVVRRITQLEASLKGLGELGIGDAHESELVRYRIQFREGQRKLLDRVSALMSTQAAAGAREILDGAIKDGLIGICAWCESIRGSDGEWMPFGHFLPRDGSYEITATICAPCRAELVGNKPDQLAG